MIDLSKLTFKDGVRLVILIVISIGIYSLVEYFFKEVTHIFGKGGQPIVLGTTLVILLLLDFFERRIEKWFTKNNE